MIATKQYRVDSFVADKAIKAPCKVASNADLTLSGEQTVNSVAVVAEDRVLVKDQDDATENGIWVVATSAWTRDGDFDGERDAGNGTLVVVAGTPLVGIYQLTATDPVVPGTTSLAFNLLSTVDLAGNLALTTNGKGASMIGVEDAASNLTATDVEAALAEIFASLADPEKVLLYGATPQTLTGAGAVNLTTPTTWLVTTGADALTLADGTEGQRKFIVMKTDGGAGTLTPDNLGNGTTITFDDAGDSTNLLFTNGAWYFMGGTATLA